jgi:hypothetical protein
MSRTWFTLSFCVAYPILFTWDRPLFSYYPLLRQWHLAATLPQSGPAMHWYGLMAGAGIVASAFGFLGRDQWIPPSARRLLWCAPVCAMAWCGMQLLHFFKPVG